MTAEVQLSPGIPPSVIVLADVLNHPPHPEEDPTTPTGGAVKDTKVLSIKPEDLMKLPPSVQQKLLNLVERMRLAIDAAEWRNQTIARLATDAQRFSQLYKQARSRLRQAEIERRRAEGHVAKLQIDLAVAQAYIAELERRLGLKVG